MVNVIRRNFLKQRLRCNLIYIKANIISILHSNVKYNAAFLHYDKFIIHVYHLFYINVKYDAHFSVFGQHYSINFRFVVNGKINRKKRC